MADIPSNLSYGTVVGRFLLAYADSNDVGSNPDAVPAQGTLYFTPSPNYIKDVTASPAPVTILPASVECSLDENGYLIGYAGDQGVRLLATDDPQGNPVDWTWKVNFRLTDATGTAVRTIPDFSFALPSGTTVDLTTAMPVTDSNGTFYLVGPTGPQGIKGDKGDTGDTGSAATISVGTITTGAAGSSASVTNVGTTGAAVFNMTIPRGDKGDKGDKGDTGDTGPTGASGLNWQGTWSASVDYVNNDAVYYQGASWFASGNPTVGEVPTLSATHWMPLALQGATGNAATVAVGTTTTGAAGSSATVTNVGTTGAAVFDFVIPRGEKGDQGIPGNLGNLSGTLPITYAGTTIGFDPTYISFIDGGTA